MRYLFVITLLVTVCSVEAQIKVAIIGSSTSNCATVNSTTECYVGRLRSFYDQAAPTDTMVRSEFAQSGLNVYQGMPTSYTTSPYPAPYQPAPGNNISAALAISPNVVIVNYPTNGYDVLPVDSILYCLRTIRDSANKKGVPCFVTTTQPRTGFDAVARLKLRELKDSILLEMGAFAIDFWTGLADPADNTILPAYRNGIDDIHFNAAGHDILYQRVMAKNIFLATLPAHFVQFNAQYRNNANIVTFNTDKETDIDSYEIQRSSDGIHFTQIGTVAPNNLPGSHQYNFKDEQPIQGLNYYKIVIVNKNGSKQASPVMTVRLNQNKLSLERVLARSGNQVVAEIQNNEAQTMHLQLFNNLGMLIATTTRKLEAGSTSIYLQTPEMNSGVYHLKLTGARGETMTKSFIKN